MSLKTTLMILISVKNGLSVISGLDRWTGLLDWITGLANFLVYIAIFLFYIAIHLRTLVGYI